MRILCLDIGQKKIGTAVSDESQIIARGLGNINRKNDVVRQIEELIKKYDIGAIVFGLPLKMDGSKSPQTERTEAFIEELKKHVSLPFIPWDERLSSKQAETILLQADLSRNKRKRLIDKLSAQIILQDYLNSQNPMDTEI
jgi:putative holliday junction resolvase